MLNNVVYLVVFTTLHLSIVMCSSILSGLKRTSTRLLGLGSKWFWRSPVGHGVQSSKPQLMCPWRQRNEGLVELQGLPDSKADLYLAMSRRKRWKLGKCSTQGPYGHLDMKLINTTATGKWTKKDQHQTLNCRRSGPFPGAMKKA